MRAGVRRPGIGGWSWLVLVLSLVIGATAAGVAKLVGGPGWLVVAAAVVGAAVPLTATAIRSHLEQRSKVAAEQRKLTAGAAGRERLVREYSAEDLRVHRAIRQVPYVARDAEEKVEEKIRSERRVLIVGPSMAGKTRLALSAAATSVEGFTLYEPADGKSIHDELAAGARFSNVLVWLDDLERYVGSGGLSHADLITLCESGSVAVVATIRSSEYSKLQPSGDIKPAGWEVPGWFGDPVWLTSWSSEELDRLRETKAGAAVLDDARKYGLSNYLGGAPLVQQQLQIGEHEHAEGFAVVRAVADWRRAGMEEPLSRADLAEILAEYLPQRHTRTIDDQITKGLEWALQPLNSTVALITEEAGGFVALDLVLELSAEAARPIPERVWFKAIQRASPGVLLDVGYRAYRVGEASTAAAAWHQAAEAGNTAAMYNLGLLLNDSDRTGARHWYTKAAEAGHTDAMYNLGVVLTNSDPTDLTGARRWWEKAAEAGHTSAMNNLGVSLTNSDPPDLDGARHWWEKAAEAGDTAAMYNLGVLLENSDPPDVIGARHWYAKAAGAVHTAAM